MSFTIRGQIEGVAEVLKALDGLTAKLRKQAVRKAVAKASQVVMKKAKALVPTQTKLLKKSLGRKVKVYRSGVAVAVVGPRKGFRQQVTRGGRSVISDPVKYAHLVELGTAPHSYKTRGGRHPGARARPFLAPAVSGQQAAIREAMAGAIAEVIQKAANAGG